MAKPTPKSNAEFVEREVTIARLNGPEPATLQQARDNLGQLPVPWCEVVVA